MAFAGRDLLAHVRSASAARSLGKDIAMIFQDPLASLNPCFTVAFQLMETLRMHGTPRSAAARRRGARGRCELLQQVEIPDPAARLDAFPHQLSGGMAQRVMIAMAIACNPRLLIADEPTTALDVTVQAQMLDLLLRLQRERGMALLLITHDLAVVAETAQRVVVMYAGQLVETGPVPEIFDAPRHPYTEALLAALPEHNVGRARLQRDSRRRAGRVRPAGAAACCRRAALMRWRAAAPSGRRWPARRDARSRCHFPLDAAGRPTHGWAEDARRQAPWPTSDERPARRCSRRDDLTRHYAVSRGSFRAEGGRARARRRLVHAARRAKRSPSSANRAAANRRWRAR